MKNKIFLFLVFEFFIYSFGFTQKLHYDDEDSILSLNLSEKGKEAGRLGDFELSISYFKKLYELRRKVFGIETYRTAVPLINIGIQYKNIGNLDKAIKTYKEAERIYINKVGPDYPGLGIVYINLGNVYRLTGDYNLALEYQINASRILAKDKIRFNRNYQDSKYNIAEIQLKLGNTTEAIKFALSNLSSTLPNLKPLMYDLLATAFRNEEKIDLADKSYLSAMKSWVDLYGENNVELVSEYLAYSSFLIAQKDYEKALLFSQKANDLVLNFFSEKSTSYAEVQSSFGDYYLMKNSEAQQFDEFRSQRKNNLVEAAQYFQNAIIALADSFQITDPFIDPPLKNIVSEISMVEQFKKKALTMEKLGDIYLSEFDRQNSIKYYNESLNSLANAVELIHRLQIGFENEDSKLFLAQNQQSTFQLAINVAYKLYKQTKNKEYINRAFEFSEKSKASNLLAAVKALKAREFGGIPDSLLKRESYLKTNIANYSSMLLAEKHIIKPDSQKVNLYSSKIFKFNEEYSKLINSFETKYPNYYAFKYENKVSGIRDIQANLSSRQALVEFFTHEPDEKSDKGELYRFVITKDSVSFTFSPIDHSYLKNIQTVHDFLTNPNYLYTKRQDFVNYSVSGYGLYQTLIKPILHTISGKDLTIIPHDKLSYIPFDALLSQFPDTSVMNFRKLDYLIRDFTINYSYSATLLYDYFNQKKTGTKNLLVFSPNYIANQPRTDLESSTPFYFNPLPGAKDEIRDISKFMKAEIFSGSQAQEHTFKVKAEEFDVLHLAMHTIINDSLPMFSKLVFSTPDEKFTDDGFLNTYEIYNLKLKARLAVLSACETGSGKLQKGEGVMSMARGFIYAGCPSIVMTMWQVDDKSGVQIMEDFYRLLSGGKRKDVALRMAKLNHLNSSDPLTAHPHYWLGYVSIGNPEPLYTSKDVYFIVLIFIVIFFFLADWYIRKKPRRKQVHY